MIFYVKGDATNPLHANGEPRVIVHCCNDQGGWGTGFVKAISRRWKEPEASYRRWFHKTIDENNSKFILGNSQLVKVGASLWVANIIGQHGYGRPTDAGYPFIRYDALQCGLSSIAKLCAELKASVHMPRIGCGLAGGEWSIVEELIKQSFVEVDVYVYDLEA